MPAELESALKSEGLHDQFTKLAYTKRKEFSRHVAEAKAEETRSRRIANIIQSLK